MNLERYITLLLLLVLSSFKTFCNGHSTQLDISDPETRILWDSLIVYNEANQYYEAIPLLHRITIQAEKSGELEALASAYENLAELSFFKGDYMEAKKYRQKISEYLLVEKKWDAYVGNLRRLANICSRTGDIQSSANYLYKAKSNIPKLTNEKYVFQIYNDMGSMFFQQGIYDSAYHYQKLLLDTVSEKDTIFLNRGNLAIANSLIGIYDFEKALFYAKQALKFTDSEKYPITYSRTLGRIGRLYFVKGNHREAESYIANALNGAKSIENNNGLLGKLHTLAALNFIKLENFQKAKEQLNLAEPFQQKENRQLLLDFHLAKWELAIIEKDKIKSENIFLIAKDLKESKDLVRSSNFLRLLSKHHELLDNRTQALASFDAYSKAKDTLRNIRNVKAIQNLEILYETDKKDGEILIAAKRIKLQRIGLVLGGALLVSILMLLNFNRKSRKRIAKQSELVLKSLEEKEILLKEIHHRVKNNLQVISSLLSIQSRSIDDGKAKEAILDGKSRVHSMSLIHQDLYKKDNLTGVRMDQYLSKLTQDLLDTYHISEGKIILNNEIAPLKLDVDSVIPLGLIVNELMSNALKYAFPEDRNGKIDVRLHEQNESLILEVSDNGIGLDPDQIQGQKDSFGHTLIRAFKHKLDAEIDIQSRQGTIISLKINNYKKVV